MELNGAVAAGGAGLRLQPGACCSSGEGTKHGDKDTPDYASTTSKPDVTVAWQICDAHIERLDWLTVLENVRYSSDGGKEQREVVC